MKNQKIVHYVTRIIFVLLLIVLLISFIIPVFKLNIPDNQNITWYIYDFLSTGTLTTGASDTTVTSSPFYGILTLIVYTSSTIFIFSKNRYIRIISFLIQFAYFGLLVEINSQINLILNNLNGLNKDYFNFGGFYFHFVMVILTWVFCLLYIIFKEIFLKVDFTKIKEINKINNAKLLYNEGTITKEEYVKIVLGEENEEN